MSQSARTASVNSPRRVSTKPSPRSQQTGAFQLKSRQASPRNRVKLEKLTGGRIIDTPPAVGPSKSGEWAGISRPAPSLLASSELPVEYADHNARLRQLAALKAIEDAKIRAARLAMEESMKKDDNSNLKVGTPRTRTQVVGMGEMLAAAAVCAELLQGAITPGAFARRVLEMPPDAMQLWLEAFAACVARLGGTLVDLHATLQKQMKSTKLTRMTAKMREMKAKAKGLEMQLQMCRDDTNRQVKNMSRETERLVHHAAQVMAVQPAVRAKLWVRAFDAAKEKIECDLERLQHNLEGLPTETNDLKSCANAICERVCKLLGCDDAAVYVSVAPPTFTGGAGKATLYRLQAPGSLCADIREEERLCTVSVHGAEAVACPKACLAAACMEQAANSAWTKKMLVVPSGSMDNRYDNKADKIGGNPQPVGLVYYDLSDPAGALRACLRVAHHEGSLHGDPRGSAVCAPAAAVAQSLSINSFDKSAEFALSRYAPIFTLSLRLPVMKAAEDPLIQSRARIVTSLTGCCNELPEATKAGGIGAITSAFADRISDLLDAEGCCLYLYDGVELVAEPPDLTCDTRIVGLDPGEMPEKQGLAGFCALTGEMIKVDNGQKESRIKPEVDVPPDYLPSGLPETHKIHTALVTPIDSISTGQIIGVAVVVNKRAKDGSNERPVFEDEDEATLFASLKVAALCIENNQLQTQVTVIKARNRRMSLGNDAVEAVD